MVPLTDTPHDCEWKRKYEGMVKERDDQIHRKRETRRILTERSAPISLLARARDHIEAVEKSYLGLPRSTVAGASLLSEIDDALRPSGVPESEER